MNNDARLAVEFADVEGVPVVRAHGEIDLYTAHEFERALESGTQKGACALIADLTDVSYLDSSGLSALLHAHKLMTARGGSIYVIASPGTPGVRRVLQITRLDTVFRVRDSVEDAAAEVKAVGPVISDQ